MMMGAHVLEQSRIAGVASSSSLGTICAYPKFAPVPFQRGRPLERLPGGDERAVRRREEGAARRRAGLPRAVRPRTRSTSCRSTSTGRATTSTSRRSHVIPALIRKMVEAQERGETRSSLWGDGSPTREFLYVDDCAEGIVLAAERYDGAEPVNLGTGEEISIRELAELDRRADRLRRRDRLGHVEAERPAAPQLDVSRAEELLRLPRADAAARGHRAHGRVVPRRSAELRDRLVRLPVFLRSAARARAIASRCARIRVLAPPARR